MAADPQHTKVSRSLWVNTTEICQAKPQQREEQNWLWSFPKLTEIARNLCICSDSCQLCFFVLYLEWGKSGCFSISKNLPWKTSCSLSHRQPTWAWMGPLPGCVTGKICAALSAYEVLVQPCWGQEQQRRLKKQHWALQKVYFAPNQGETGKIPTPPNAHLNQEIRSSKPRTVNSFTFHFDCFHGNHKIKLCSYFLQHYIIHQTLSCFSTNMFLQGSFFFCQPDQPDLCWSV